MSCLGEVYCAYAGGKKTPIYYASLVKINHHLTWNTNIQINRCVCRWDQLKVILPHKAQVSRDTDLSQAVTSVWHVSWFAFQVVWPPQPACCRGASHKSSAAASRTTREPQCFDRSFRFMCHMYRMFSTVGVSQVCTSPEKLSSPALLSNLKKICPLLALVFSLFIGFSFSYDTENVLMGLNKCSARLPRRNGTSLTSINHRVKCSFLEVLFSSAFISVSLLSSLWISHEQWRKNIGFPSEFALMLILIWLCCLISTWMHIRPLLCPCYKFTGE